MGFKDLNPLLNGISKYNDTATLIIDNDTTLSYPPI
jgi:hypothetical protein